MTQARKLKKQIRARARKTGESYTAARHQLLEPRTPRPLTTPRPSADAFVPASLRKGEARLVERTGHGSNHWFAVLDAFGAAQKGHTAAARHVGKDHGVDGWYAQQITVQYERARGLRAVNQRSSGEYEVSVSKVLPCDVGAVARALCDTRGRASWLRGTEAWLRKDLEAALRGAKGLRLRDRGDARLRFRTKTATVDLSIDPKPGGRASFVASNMKLKAKEDIDRYRTAWRKVLETLSRHLAQT